MRKTLTRPQEEAALEIVPHQRAPRIRCSGIFETASRNKNMDAVHRLHNRAVHKTSSVNLLNCNLSPLSRMLHQFSLINVSYLQDSRLPLTENGPKNVSEFLWTLCTFLGVTHFSTTANNTLKWPGQTP